MRLRKEELVVLVVYGLVGWGMLTSAPLVWPDEAVYADIARNWWREGRMGTDLWQGMIPGVERLAGWNPPVFWIMLAMWSRVWGDGIGAQRNLSLIVGGVMLVLAMRVAEQLVGKKSGWRWWLGLGLTSNVVFMWSARISRPEIYILMFILAGLYWLLGVGKREEMNKVLAGIMMGLGMLVHPLAVLWVAWGGVMAGRKMRKWYVMGVVLMAGGWVTVLVNRGWLGLVMMQMKLASQGKGEESWVTAVMNPSDPIEAKIAVVVSIGLSGWLGWLAIRQKRKEARLVVGWLGIAWLSVFIGRTSWYMSYVVVYLYLAWVVVWSRVERCVGRGLLGVMVLLVGLNGVLTVREWRNAARWSYDEYAREVVEAIPEGRTVMLSVVPDPYFGFKEAGRKNWLYEFPVVEMDAGEYRRILDKCDYVVYGDSYNRKYFGDLLERYLEKNKVGVVSINESGKKVWVIELTTKEERR